MARPVVTAANASIARGQTRLASELFSVSDGDGDAVTLYEFWDSGLAATSGYFTVGGNPQASNASIAIDAALLGQVRFAGGSVAGPETVWVRARAGGEFSDWVSWTMTTTGSAPTASAVNRGAHVGQAVAAASLFSVNDVDGDPFVSYEFWDSGTGASSGHFAVDGVEQAANSSIEVAAADLGTVTYVGGIAPGTETVWVRAADAGGYGGWVSWTMSTGNATPVISTTNRTLAKNQSIAASTLFSVFDAEADTIAAYEFWDDGTGANSGRFRIGGTPQSQGVGIAVDPADLVNTTFVAGTAFGAETLWVRAHDGIGWGLWKSVVVTTANQIPTVTASNASVVRNAQALASGLFSVSDADGDAMASYEFWDSGAATGSGHFTLNGVAQAANTSIAVSAANLANTRYVGGTGPGSETIWVRVNDGIDWSAWVSWTMTTTGSAPAVSASSRGVHTGQSVAASSLFSVSDPDSDPITAYEFWDSGTGASSGRFTILGVPQAQNASIVVPAANLAQVSYQGGSVNGAEIVWVRASDATGYGDWVSWTMTTGNSAPVVSAPNTTLAKNQSVAASTLFSVSDPESDPITQYEFWDDGLGVNSGRFRISGTPQGQNVSIPVAAANLANLTFATGSATGPEKLWLRAFDGFDWSPWTGLTLTTANQAPTVAATDADVAWGQSTSVAPMLAPADADADAITAYEFWDDGLGANSGYFTLSGIKQATNAAIPVSAAQLANLHFVGGYTAGAEKVWVRVNDGSAWSPWTPWFITTTGNAPIATAANNSVGTEMSVAASTLFSVVDADADPITQYEFWDDGAATTSGHFAIDGVAQADNASILVNAADLSKVTYVGGENPGTERLWVRANDGDGWGPWTSWNMASAIRFPEVIGDSGNNSFTSALGTDKVYFGLGGNDNFQAQNGDEVLLMGGAGSDTYTIGSLSNVFITVYENGNSAGDFIMPALNAVSDTAVLATIDGRHLLLGDAATNRLVLVIDWQLPANQIETWFIAGPPEIVGSGHFSYSAFANIVAETEPPNITFDELVAEAPEALAGFSSAVFNEMLTYYAQRESAIANNVAPVVTAIPAQLRDGQTIAVSALFSVTDGNGNAIQRYEIVDTTLGDATGRLLQNGNPVTGGEIEVLAAELGTLTFSAATFASTDNLQIRAYDGIAWSAPTSVGVTTQPNRAPEVIPYGTLTAPLGRAVPVSSWFGTSDADRDAVAQYEFTDGGEAAGQFVLAGVVQTGGFTVSAAQLDTLMYVTSGGTPFTENITARVSDGQAWSNSASLSLNAIATGNRPAEVRLTNPTQLVVPGEAVLVSTWFTAIDPDGDPITGYRFFDHTPSYSGFFQVSGIAQGNDTTIAAADLGNVTYAADPDVPGTHAWSGDSVSLNATDTDLTFSGVGMGLTVYTTANRRPTLTATDAAIGLNQSAAVSSLLGLSVSDPDGDPVVNYLFQDLGGAPGSGYFTLNGVPQANGAFVYVGPTELGQLRYVGGSQAGTETIRARVTTNASLGTSPSSDWISVGIRSGDPLSDGAGNTLGAARVVSVAASSTQAFDDVVGDSDLLDYYRLDVAAGGNLVLALTRLGGNADLQLLDNGGSVLASSLNPDNWSERITQTVAAGTYYARVVPVAGHDTSYHFAVSLV